MLLRRIEVLDQVKIEQGECIYQTMENTQGMALSVKPLDVETINRDSAQKSFAQVFSEIDSDTRIKIISKARKVHNNHSKLSRTQAINEIGFMEYENFLLLERTIPDFQKLRSYFTKEEIRDSNTEVIKLRQAAASFKNLSIPIGAGFSMRP